MAPLFGFGSFVRRARFFHPEGRCYLADVVPAASDRELEEAAERLAGDALVRLSNAWWRRGHEWPDVMGFAVRFMDVASPRFAPGPHDQDLLLATIPRPWMTPFSPLWTNPHDFQRNTYYGVSPFDLRGVGRVMIRLISAPSGGRRGGRFERIERAIDRQRAVFRLEVRRVRRGEPWQPLVDIDLRGRVDVDQAALRFNPFRVGRGLEPRGPIHAMRRAVYKASQWARPDHD